MSTVHSHTNLAEASRHYFNRWAPGYDRSWTQVWFRENHRLIVQAMDPPPDARILDLGCGTGQLAARLAQRVPHGSVCGVDPAEEMIGIARRQHQERANLRFEVGSSDAIPAAGAAFDFAVSTISFHHWAQPAESLREIARVLRPEGRLLILDLCRDRALMAVIDRLQRWRQPSHAGIASTREIRRYCARAGFRKIHITKPRWLLMLAEGTLDKRHADSAAFTAR
jgi:ubiquinone/menaquinone biosynthesis C-methylase UbiE